MGGSGATRLTLPTGRRSCQVCRTCDIGAAVLRQSWRDDSVRVKDGWVEVGAETAWPTGISQQQSRNQQESRKVIDLADLV